MPAPSPAMRSADYIHRARSSLTCMTKTTISYSAQLGDHALHCASAALNTAKKMLESDEGRQLRSSAGAFWRNFVIFVGMLAMKCLSLVEDALGVGAQQPAAPSQRVRTVLRATCEKVDQRVSRRQKQVEGSLEAEVYDKVRWVVCVWAAVLGCVFKALAAYEGPAKEYVAPVAQGVCAVLPYGEGGEERQVEMVKEE